LHIDPANLHIGLTSLPTVVQRLPVTDSVVGNGFMQLLTLTASNLGFEVTGA